jgi:hypothetical protein
MALFENVVARPIAYQGEKGRWKMRNSQLAITPFIRPYPVHEGDYIHLAKDRHPA